jgi:hypothetical protein
MTDIDLETLLLAIRFGHCSAVHAATLREAGGAWALDAVRENERLRAIEEAAKTWMGWGGHCPTCAFVFHREGNPLLNIELLLDYCDCGWYAASAALAAKRTP